MFIVRPSSSNLPIITEVGKEKKTLAELGVKDLTEVVVFDADVQGTDGHIINTTELYHAVALKFGITRHEYEAFLPKIDNGAEVTNWFDSAPNASGISSYPKQTQQQDSLVPPEYQNDPDLWYAIQASLGEDTVPTGRHLDDALDMAMDEGTDDGFDQTYRNASTVEIAHNVSMDGASSPNRGREVGPIFDANEFGPGSTAPQVQESALITQINQQKKQTTKVEYAKLLREEKRALFE